MAGIENITNEILQEAKDKAASVIAEAEKAAEKKLADTAAENEKFLAKAAEKADVSAKNYSDRIASQAAMRKRQTILSARQGLIEDIIGEAQKSLAAQSDADYFAMIEKLVKRHLTGGSGEILFGKKDLSRLPADFAGKLADLAKEAGGTLKLNEEAADIADGFILRYGGIDENCTLTALFAEKKDALWDKVHEVLW